MKKFFSAAMALALMLSISQTAFAAGTEINQDSENKSGKTAVTLAIDPAYTVTIPEKVVLDEQSNGTYAKDAQITCSSAKLLADKTVNVTMESDFKLTDAETGKATLPYTVKTDAYDYDIANGDTIAEFKTSESEQTSILHFTADEPKYAGDYSGTATFTVGLEKKSILVSTEEELNSALESGTPAKLANDLTVSQIPTGATIDLNGKTLTTTQCPTFDEEGKCIATGETVIKYGENFTIKNGTVIENSFSPDDSLNPVFPVEDNSTFTLNHVNITTIGNVTSVYGRNITVNIKNSVITTKSICLGIGEGYDGTDGITFNIENSTLETTDADSVPVAFTALGNLNIKNSTLSGGRQGVVVRAGDAKISNSAIISKATEETIAENDWNKYLNDDWYLLNEVPVAALVVGNRGTLPFDVSCTLNNVKFKSPGTDIYAAATDSHKTTVTGISADDTVDTYNDETGVLTIK